ncbi:MAG: hypothetical protein ABL898_17035 [Hyphomicrobiaceae bacterium]|nr:hypothetical protein [Hyphomicrobiaceae bacterium]
MKSSASPLKLICVHTGAIHVETFRPLLTALDASVAQDHVVRIDWLDRARTDVAALGHMSPELQAEIAAELTRLSAAADAVLCTCTTLGPVVDDVAALNSKVLRIDRPMMDRAANHDGTIVVAMCLESTRAPTLAALEAARQKFARDNKVAVIMCADAWPHFEAGDKSAFSRVVAGKIAHDLKAIANPACIVLAQASMADAAAQLQELAIPVYASPHLAAEAVVAVARQHANLP